MYACLSLLPHVACVSFKRCLCTSCEFNTTYPYAAKEVLPLGGLGSTIWPVVRTQSQCSWKTSIQQTYLLRLCCLFFPTIYLGSSSVVAMLVLCLHYKPTTLSIFNAVICPLVELSNSMCSMEASTSLRTQPAACVNVTSRIVKKQVSFWPKRRKMSVKRNMWLMAAIKVYRNVSTGCKALWMGCVQEK